MKKNNNNNMKNHLSDHIAPIKIKLKRIKKSPLK